jgi:hypothetical protein
MFVPTEIWELILSSSTIQTCRLINKAICNQFRPKFIRLMHYISPEHKMTYYKTADKMVFFDQFYEVSHSKSNAICRNYILNHNIDLLSMYNILKVRDIYQTNYAKSYILKLLALGRLPVYSQSDKLIMHEWLLHNLDMMGLQLIMPDVEKYETNIIMYKKLENHIRENL